ncbi:MAG: ABC transporter permease, partial [Caldilineaceae bacterium]|nr:ABC transporter permease [Caldilineaceae bacterium]
LLSFFAPIRNFATTLADRQASGDYPQLANVAAIGSIATQELFVKEPADSFWSAPTVAAVDAGYVTQAAQVYSFRQRAPGFADDAAIWQALRERTDVAIVTPDILRTTDDELSRFFDGPRGNRRPQRSVNYGPFWIQSGVASTDPLPDLYIYLSPDATESTGSHRVQIIGVLDDNTTLAGEDIQINLATLQAVTGVAPTPNRFYIKVTNGADVHAVAQEVERAFVGNGLNSVILAESFAQGQILTRGILQLFQGFMALGLLVGIAALGVIMSRTVVERRQQVGMLRAIGYQSDMIALSFVIEASFIAIAGLLIGAVTGIVLGQSLIMAFFTDLAPTTEFVVPWGQIAVILVGSYLFALLTTIVPAYQAARVYPAEALRYEG